MTVDPKDTPQPGLPPRDAAFSVCCGVAKQAQPPSVGSLLGSFLILVLVVFLLVWAGRHAFGEPAVRLEQVQGTLRDVALTYTDSDSEVGSSRHYRTTFHVQPAQGQARGPLKLAGDQRQMLSAIQGQVSVLHDANRLVVELKDDMKVYVHQDSWIRGRHIARVMAVCAFLVVGIFALSQGARFVLDLLMYLGVRKPRGAAQNGALAHDGSCCGERPGAEAASCDVDEKPVR